MMRGEEERIRPCVGAGYCLGRIYVGGDALCLHNPATSRNIHAAIYDSLRLCKEF